MLRTLSLLAPLLALAACASGLSDNSRPTSTLTALTLATPEAVGDSLLAWADETRGVSLAQSQGGHLVVVREGRGIDRVVVRARVRADGLTEVVMQHEVSTPTYEMQPLAITCAFNGRGAGALLLPADGSEPCESVEDWKEYHETPPNGTARPRGEEIVEVAPELIGGLEGLQRRVAYPEEMRRAGVQGVVLLGFVASNEGAVECPQVLASPNPGLSAAALAALVESRFRPGTQGGRAVSVRYTLPISFWLR